MVCDGDFQKKVSPSVKMVSKYLSLFRKNRRTGANNVSSGSIFIEIFIVTASGLRTDHVKPI